MPNLALFDFDGTISFKDNFIPFIFYATVPRRLAIGKIILSPLILGYKLKIVPATVIRRCIVCFSFRGRREKELRKLGKIYSREVVSQSIRPYALERIQWHKSQGDTIVVVSASLDVYLLDWCNKHELDLMSSKLEVRKDGVLTGRYIDGDYAGKEKARRVRTKYDLLEYPVIYAYGDSQEDKELLSLAHKKYFCWREVV